MSNSIAQIDSLKVGILGVGVMGEALLAGVITAGAPASNIAFVEKRPERSAEIVAKFGAQHRELEDVVRESDLLLLVVKPQDLGDLLDSFNGHLKKTALLVSFAAGKSTKFIEGRLDGEVSVIRVMPNTPLLIGKGMSVLSAGAHASSSQMKLISKLLAASGDVWSVEENLQDAVTAMSGSGPAYFFAFIEAMVTSGQKLGLDEQTSTRLAIQTIVGAAGMLQESGKSATTLRENVTSPNGTTAAALKVFSEGGLTQLVDQAMTAARDRSVELG